MSEKESSSAMCSMSVKRVDDMKRMSTKNGTDIMYPFPPDEEETTTSAFDVTMYEKGVCERIKSKWKEGKRMVWLITH